MKYLILIALFAFASAQEIETNRTFPIFDRPCSERSAIIRPNVKTAFNVAAYSGTWFEIGRYQQEDEAESDCMSSSYSWGFISRTFSIIRTGVDLAGNQTFTRNATALLSFPDVTPTLGLLNVTYYANREANEVNYYVLGTDYFQYALGWGCEDIEEGLSREYAWVLSRTPDLPENYRARVDAYIVRYLDPQFIRETNQDDDVQLMAQSLQSKFVFRSSILLDMCSLNYIFVFAFIAFVSAQHISDNPCPERPVQQNFDIVKYTSGVWYDVLRYEASFSRGCDCGFAKYTLNDDNSVKVRNCCKRLPNTTLTCSLGQAVLSEPEHVPLEGKINVGFGTRPNNVSNYWILSTDYDNYSVVYFCKNIEDNKSREFAWLLSREPQLNPTVKATADGLIDTHFDRNKMYQAEQSAQRCDPRDE